MGTHGYRGMCRKHYEEWRKNTRPLPVCSVEGCTNSAISYSNPYCSSHRAQIKAHGAIVYEKLRTTKSEVDCSLRQTWTAMKQRCYNQNDRHYADYGERGIKVCDRWLDHRDGYRNFVKDMGKRPDGYSIDRIDPDGDYCPENCRWANRHVQNTNYRTGVNLPVPNVRVAYNHGRPVDNLWEVRLKHNGKMWRKRFNDHGKAVIWRDKMVGEIWK